MISGISRSDAATSPLCDGGVLLMASLFGLYPFLLTLYADSGYQGGKFRDGLAAACHH